jgi:hypothetical protein
MTFAQETIDRLTVRDVRELERVMEVMAKFHVSLPTVVQSLGVMTDAREPHHWRFFPPYDDFEYALEAYNKLAEHDGYNWTPPSERK